MTPATFFALLPAANRQGDPKYVAQDVFGYSFLSDVFMADYKDGNDGWQGFHPSLPRCSGSQGGAGEVHRRRQERRCRGQDS